MEESGPLPPDSAGRESGYRIGHSLELAGRRELAVLAHSPAEQLLRVGVDRVQVAAITGKASSRMPFSPCPAEAGTGSRSLRLRSAVVS